MNIHKKNLTIGVLGAALLATSGLSAVDAANRDPLQQETQRRGADMREVVEDRDYDAWTHLDHLPPQMADFTEAEFNQFADMMELRQSGDEEGANALREQLGLKEAPNRRGDNGMGPHNGNRGNMGEMHEFIRNGDFSSWAKEAQEHGIQSSLLTKENFNKIKAAVESGDRDAVQAVHEELGIVPMHKGEPKGKRAQKILELSYDEWVAQAEDHGMDSSLVNEQTYNTLRESATLFQAGDVDAAKTLLDDAGITPPRDARGHKGMGEQGPRGLR